MYSHLRYILAYSLTKIFATIFTNRLAGMLKIGLVRAGPHDMRCVRCVISSGEYVCEQVCKHVCERVYDQLYYWYILIHLYVLQIYTLIHINIYFVYHIIPLLILYMFCIYFVYILHILCNYYYLCILQT